MLKRYVVFVPSGFESQGGWKDVLCKTDDNHRRYPGIGGPLSFDSIGEASAAAWPVIMERSYYGSFHVVDLQTGEIVASRN